MTESKKKSFFQKSAIFAMGAACGLSLAGGVAFADDINVSLNPLKLLVNGIDKTPTDNQFNNNGASVPAELIYNGTTYLPVRMVSNLLGTPISYDGANKTIHIGTDPVNATYLSDMQPYAMSANEGAVGTMSNNDQDTADGYADKSIPAMTMGGNSYAKGVSIRTDEFVNGENKVFYNLNGKYASLSGQVGLDDISDNYSHNVVTIYGDGKQIWSHEFQKGDLPTTLNIPVTGVMQLEIEIQDKADAQEAYLDIVNPILK